jgi:hypothetical protein
MKHISIFGFLLMAGLSAFAAQNKGGTFSGEIMDKQCAQMGSHENMMKSEGANNTKECTLACVKSGDTFALLDPQTKKVYAIDNENKVREYAGERVEIKGDYDETTDVLHVKSIARAQ